LSLSLSFCLFFLPAHMHSFSLTHGRKLGLQARRRRPPCWPGRLLAPQGACLLRHSWRTFMRTRH
jgi:hypothetical protein